MRRRALLLAAVVAVGCLAGRGSGARAQTSERILNYAVDVTVQHDDSLRVAETIEYDFGIAERHGIFRDIPTRLRYDDTYDRVYPLMVERVEADRGASATFATEDGGGGTTRIRIGDPNRTVSGTHTYRITYTIGAALNGFESRDELYWNAIGADWAVPIERAEVVVHLPAPITSRVACFQGPTGSALSCDRAEASAGSASFAGAHLDTYEGLTVVVGFPKGTVAPPAPILVERWSLGRAFTLDAPRIAAALLVLVASVWLVIRLVWRGGRDLRWRGSPVEVVFGGTAGEQRVPLFEGGAYAIEYMPPDDIRPGQVGTLLDEVAHPRDVSASIVDLAARGYLHIEEMPSTGWFGKRDWRFLRQPDPTEKRALQPFERRLLDSLFQDGDVVLLASLKEHFAARLALVQDDLYADVVNQGWFGERPDRRRAKWLGISVLALGGAIGLVVAAAAFTHFAIVPVPLVVGALLLLVLHGRMPRRTAKGTATLRRTLGFRQFIETAETRRAEFAEKAGLFYEYLPYAVVFGCVDRWAHAFEGLAMPAPDWYTSTSAFSALYFADAMDGFADTTSGALMSTPGGSGGSGFSGGFSGGGGGGGGGGSW